jgi:endonuclease G
VPVPNQFYKIIIDELNGKPRVLGFVIDHGAPRTKSFDQFLMNVKAIESLAGVDFFPSLPSSERARLEKAKPKKVWNFSSN